MALSAPLLTRKRVLQVSLEAAKGDGTAPATDVLVFDLIMDPADAFVERKGSGKFLGHTSPGVLEGTKAGICNFKCELRATAAATLDAGLAILLQACGLLKTAGVFTPTSLHASQKTIAMACYEDGKKKVLNGASGTANLTPENGRLVWNFSFSGVWVAPVDGDLPAVAYSVVKPISWGHASNAFSLNSLGVKISTFDFNLGNTVVPRFQNGKIAYYMITDRDPTLTIDPEADLVVSTHDPYGAWLAGTEVAVSLAVTDGTATVTLAGDKFQYREVKNADREGIQTDDVTGQFNIKVINTGDDEFSIIVT